jgi:hypothetical protein
MGSSLKDIGFVKDTSRKIGAVHADPFAHPGFVFRRAQEARSQEVTTLNRTDRSVIGPATKLPHILLVDAARTLHESHLALLRSIPACVEALGSCSEMYFHDVRAYALVILVPHPQSKETAEAAQFVRHQWSTAKILLLDSESALVDDWLYDDRAEPHLHPAMIRGAAIRLMYQEEYWIHA